MTIRYSSNNSGGHWWLNDEHWKALEAAGWHVEWVKDRTEDYARGDEDGRWLGALATAATRDGLGLDAAIAEWESVVRMSATDEGCPCCGEPHYFREVRP